MQIKIDLTVDVMLPPIAAAKLATQALSWQRLLPNRVIFIPRTKLLATRQQLPKKTLLRMWAYFQTTQEPVSAEPPSEQQIIWASYGGKPAQQWLYRLQLRGLL